MKYKISYENAVSNRGNRSRIRQVMRRALNGEELTVGFLGGSITQGSLSTKPELCYAYHVYEWWQKTFPKAHFTYLNAGIGATDSQFGCARVDTDLLAYHPDFVIVEFSVNDDPTEHFMETYEGLVRRIYSSKDHPAMMLVHNVFYHSGSSAQVIHSRIGRHYDLPSVSMQSTIYPEVVSGRIPNREITPDDLHPNDDGHELVASVITCGLEQILKDLDSQEPAERPYPQPLTANGYEHCQRLSNRNAQPILTGFTADPEPQNGITDCFKNGWRSSHQGDSIYFEVEASSIAVQYRKTIALPAPVAELILDGDESHPYLLDANFDETWGDKLQLDTIMEHGPEGKHTVLIRIRKAHENDQKPFCLVSVIAAR